MNNGKIIYFLSVFFNLWIMNSQKEFGSIQPVSASVVLR